MTRSMRRRLPQIHLTHEHFQVLWTGHDYFQLFATPDDQFTAWRYLREELLEKWIAQAPFTRPQLWWEYEAPARRECLQAPHPFDSPLRQDRELYYGLPRSWVVGDPPYSDYETEQQYLTRLDLLSAAERSLL